MPLHWNHLPAQRVRSRQNASDSAPQAAADSCVKTIDSISSDLPLIVPAAISPRFGTAKQFPIQSQVFRDDMHRNQPFATGATPGNLVVRDAVQVKQAVAHLLPVPGFFDTPQSKSDQLIGAARPDPAGLAHDEHR